MRYILLAFMTCGAAFGQLAVEFTGQPGAIPVRVGSISGTGCIPTAGPNQILVAGASTGTCQPAAPTISGTTITASLTGAASLNLLASSNLSDLASAATARTNLGLTVLATTTPGTGVATFLTTPTSANLAGALTDESGTGVVCFTISCAMTTPNLGTPSAINLTNATALPAAAMPNAGVHTGDAAGTFPAVTLTTVNANVGSFGDATHTGQFTVNAKGLITAAASVLITGAGGSSSVFTGSTGVTSAFSATPTFSLADVSVKSPIIFQPAIMTASVTAVTFTNLSAGARFSILWLSASSGGPFTVTYGSSVSSTYPACQVSATASGWTLQSFQVLADGTTVAGIGCISSDQGITLPGSTSGSLTIVPAAVAGTNSKLTLPGGTTDLSATGGTSQVVQQSSTGAALTVGQLACAALSNSTALCSTTPGTGVAMFLTTPTSANLAGALTDESGTGVVCFTISCAMTTPNIGAALGTSLALGGSTNACTGGTAGCGQFDQGTVPSGLPANGIQDIAPTSVTSYRNTRPGAVGSTGVDLVVVSGTTATHTYGPLTASLIPNTTASNCSSAASPAVCGAAPAGAVAVPTGVTSVTLVVNTSAVTANSEIFLQSDDSLTIAATTCNSTLATLVGGVVVTARTPGTSFTITYNGTIATNPLCVAYRLVN